MIDGLRTWLISVTAASLLVAVLQAILPKGGIRTVGKMVGGLVLLLAVVQPILQIELDDVAIQWEVYQEELSQYSETLEGVDENLLEVLIAEQSSTYIQDKAVSQGIVCTVVVVTTPDEEGNPIPSHVTIMGDLTPQEQAWLTQEIVVNLGIAAQEQTYQGR